RRNSVNRPLLQRCAGDQKERRTRRLERGTPHGGGEHFCQCRRLVDRLEGNQKTRCVARHPFGGLPRIGQRICRGGSFDLVTLTRRVLFTGGRVSNRFGLPLAAKRLRAW